LNAKKAMKTGESAASFERKPRVDSAKKSAY
jgi:hypothetical protein